MIKNSHIGKYDDDDDDDDRRRRIETRSSARA